MSHSDLLGLLIGIVLGLFVCLCMTLYLIKRDEKLCPWCGDKKHPGLGCGPRGKEPGTVEDD